MDNLIIPNWHPLLVHFTVALTIVSAAFFVLSKVIKSKTDTFERVAKWTLWTGAGITVLTILAGFDAYNSVAHDDVAHKVMKVHRNWALGTGVAILLMAIWTLRTKAVSSVMVAASLVVAGLVGATGYLGAELVFRHGLGVMRLPDTSGENHAHAEGGGGHDHGEAKSEEAPHAHMEGEAHDDTKVEEAIHEHAEGEGHGDMAAKPMEQPAEHANDGGHDHGESGHGASAEGMMGPTAIANALYPALQSGDVEAVNKLLADDVLIIEGGHAQTSKAEYMGGHMKADMAFVPNMTREILGTNSGQGGDRAWVVTHSRTFGSYKGKDYDEMGRSFFLLRRDGDTWKIAVIEWADK